MKTKPLLLIVATVLVVLGAYQVTRSKAPSTNIESALLYPTLLESLNDAQSVEIANSKDRFRITRDGERWVMADRDGFPVETTLVRSLLMEVAALKIREEKTAKAENYPTIGVEDVSAPNAGGVELSVQGKSGALLSLIVGKSRKPKGTEAGGHFVRRAGEPTALLVEGEINIKAKRNDWLDISIVTLTPDRVRKASIQTPGQDPVVVSKASTREQLFALQNVPQGKEPKSSALVSNVGALLLDLRFEDVASAKNVAGLTPTNTAQLETFDGLLATLKAYEVAGRTLIALEFEHQPEGAEALPAASGKTTDAAAKDAPKAPDVAAEVAKLKARTGPWVYQIGDYKLRTLRRSFAELVKVKEKPMAPATAD